jgi:hypothetical protein
LQNNLVSHLDEAIKQSFFVAILSVCKEVDISAPDLAPTENVWFRKKSENLVLFLNSLVLQICFVLVCRSWGPGRICLIFSCHLSRHPLRPVHPVAHVVRKEPGTPTPGQQRAAKKSRIHQIVIRYWAKERIETRSFTAPRLFMGFFVC